MSTFSYVDFMFCYFAASIGCVIGMYLNNRFWKPSHGFWVAAAFQVGCAILCCAAYGIVRSPLLALLF